MLIIDEIRMQLPNNKWKKCKGLKSFKKLSNS
jgi:hypothetical protein